VTVDRLPAHGHVSRQARGARSGPRPMSVASSATANSRSTIQEMIGKAIITFLADVGLEYRRCHPSLVASRLS
jgi:hypothetical protein